MLSTVAFALAACQPDSCRIKGEAKEFEDSTLLYLSTDLRDGHPFDSIRVDDGRFYYRLETDSTCLCLLYPATKHPMEGVTFFTERGNVYIELSPETAASRVSGTVINNEWQALNDRVSHCDQQLRETMQEAKDSIIIRRLYADVDSLYEGVNQAIRETALRNRDNALGRFINRHYNNL